MRLCKSVVANSLMLGVLTMSVPLAGCQRRQTESSPLGEEDTEHVLVMIFDLSKSFSPYMSPDGPAFEFAMKTIDQYFRARIGTQDKVVLGQISATGQPLLFEGTPHELRKRFPDATSFHDYLKSQADPNGSQVYAGVQRTVEYLQQAQRTKYPNAQGLLLVLSDMQDTSAQGKAAARAMLQTLSDYAADGQAMGFYFVEPTVAKFLDQHLRELGVTNLRVESNIVSSPLIPTLN